MKSKKKNIKYFLFINFYLFYKYKILIKKAYYNILNKKL